MEDLFLQYLITTSRSLAEQPFWCELLAENVKWASCEAFLQSSLLGAFNNQANDHVADRERVLWNLNPRLRVQPDLVLLKREVQQEWWSQRGYSREVVNPRPLEMLCSAVAQLKVIWTPRNYSGASASPTAKWATVSYEVAALREYRQIYPGCRTYYGALIAGLHGDNEWNSALDVVCRAATTAGVVPTVEAFSDPVQLLDGVTPGSGGISSNQTDAWAWLFWIPV